MLAVLPTLEGACQALLGHVRPSVHTFVRVQWRQGNTGDTFPDSKLQTSSDKMAWGQFVMLPSRVPRVWNSPVGTQNVVSYWAEQRFQIACWC